MGLEAVSLVPRSHTQVIGLNFKIQRTGPAEEFGTNGKGLGFEPLTAHHPFKDLQALFNPCPPKTHPKCQGGRALAISP